MTLLKPKSYPKLEPGTEVFHKRYGIGKIIEEWGSWWACRECYDEIKPVISITVNEYHGKIDHRMLPQNCPSCGKEMIPFRCVGHSTYDVNFKGKLHSIYRSRLQLV